MKFLKKVGLKIKVAFGVALGLGAAILFFFIKRKADTKEYIEFELDRVLAEKEIAVLEKESNDSEKKLEELEAEESKIRKKIRLIEDAEVKGEEVSLEELNKFFKDRGF